jgi:hypothetical protein
LKHSSKAEAVITGDKAKEATTSFIESSLLSEMQAKRQEYFNKKRKRVNRESDTMAKLDAFQSMLRKTKNEISEDDDTKIESNTTTSDLTAIEEAARTHGELDGIEETDEGWWKTSLKFKRHIDDAYRYGMDASEYVTEDPLGRFGEKNNMKKKLESDVKTAAGFVDGDSDLLIEKRESNRDERDRRHRSISRERNSYRSSSSRGDRYNSRRSRDKRDNYSRDNSSSRRRYDDGRDSRRNRSRSRDRHNNRRR